MRKGFTLIELLIVVAIIAILAAIAVPNFMEAQVRSKVARVKADMRSIATAIESYAVDYHRHPLDVAELKRYGGDPGFDTQMGQMTTPVAYMTTIPPDPFTEYGMIDKDGKNALGPKSKTFIYTTSEKSKENGGSDRSYKRGYTWWLQSYGPSRTRRHPVTNDVVWSEGILTGEDKFGPLIYDTTNGTKSFGFIMRTNKGEFTGADWQPR